VQLAVVSTAAANGVTIHPGETWHFQAWFRDGNGSPCGGLSNLSSAYSVTFTP